MITPVQNGRQDTGLVRHGKNMNKNEFLKAVDDYLTKDVRKEQKKKKKHTVYKPPSWKKDNPGKYQVLEAPEPDEDQGPS